MLALAGRMSAEDHRAETVYSTSAGGVNAFVVVGGIVGGVFWAAPAASNLMTMVSVRRALARAMFLAAQQVD